MSGFGITLQIRYDYPNLLGNFQKEGSVKKQFFMDRIFLGVLVVFFGVILQQSIGLSRSASLMPRFFSVIGILLCSFVFLTGIAKERKAALNAAGGEEKKEEKDWRMAGQAAEKGLPFYMVISVVIGYFLLLVFLGYIVSSIIVMLAIPLLMKYQKKVTIIILALVSTLLLFFTFRYFFRISLPLGLLFEALF